MVVMLGVFLVLGIQPLLMMVGLIILILGYSLLIYYSMGSFWFSYMMMIVMLSGVLVLFSYMVSLSPNDSFEVIILMGMVILFVGMNSGDWTHMCEDMGTLSLGVWGDYLGCLIIYLVGFLLTMMLMVIWLSGVWEGAIREFMSAWLKG